MAKPTFLTGRRCMAVMVLGTALTTMATADVRGAEQGVTDLTRYCTACWRNARLPADCWSDCTQEVFTRLMQKVRPETWSQLLRTEGEERKEFLRAIDAVKKRTQRGLRRTGNLVSVVPDEREPRQVQLQEDWNAVQSAADQVLSERQQRILRLCYEGWEINEIAEEMTLPPERVSDEKYKAIRKLRQHLQVA